MAIEGQSDSFDQFIIEQGGDQSFVDFLSENGFTSKLALANLNLDSPEGKALAEGMKYGHRCLLQGLVSLCSGVQPPRVPEPTSIKKKIDSMVDKTSSGTIRTKLGQLFHLSSGGPAKSSRSATDHLQQQQQSIPNQKQDQEFGTTVTGKRQLAQGGNFRVFPGFNVRSKGKGKGKSGTKRIKVKESRLKVVIVPENATRVPFRKVTTDLWLPVDAVASEVVRKLCNELGWPTDSTPKFKYAQGKNLRDATLSDVSGAEEWDFESLKALAGSGCLYVLKSAADTTYTLSCEEADADTDNSDEVLLCMPTYKFMYII